jgi:glycine/D-amino acid oxidase-like deaminating enzyme/nitrite reductase/ring-hydroxylating ferredoxin subunit
MKASARSEVSMLRDQYESIPVWHDPFAERIHTEPPSEAEVCVIGAGIAGLSTAYLLQREGIKVQVLEAYDVGAGETGRTSAHLSAVLDDRLSRLEQLFGRERATLAVESHQVAIDRIEAVVRDESIDCDFARVDAYLVASTPEQRELLLAEQAASVWAGFRDVEQMHSLRQDCFAFDGLGLRFPGQAAFHAGRYLRGLARAFLRRGGRISIGARAVKVTGGSDACVTLADGQRVHARHVVVATNTPFNDRVKMHTKQHAYRSYMVGFAVTRDAFPSFLLSDLGDPYYYARRVRVGPRDLLIVGGADHKAGQRNDAPLRYRAIESWSRSHFNGLGEVTHRWSGQVMEPIDGLAFIGRNPLDEDNVYIATGDSGHGLTHGTIAGMLIRDLITGRENRYAKLFEPSRKTVRAAGTYLGENANFVGHMIRDWAKGAEVGERAEIPCEHGAILRDGVAPVAAYRDAEGVLHEVSAVCTHLGCVVQWNGGEKSWDCPCHGSRFGVDGAILNGPARLPLAPVNPVPATPARKVASS